MGALQRATMCYNVLQSVTMWYNVPILTEEHGPSVFKHKVLNRNKSSDRKTLHRLLCAVCNVVLFITKAADIQHSQLYGNQIEEDEMGETCSVLPDMKQAYKLYV